MAKHKPLRCRNSTQFNIVYGGGVPCPMGHVEMRRGAYFSVSEHVFQQEQFAFFRPVYSIIASKKSATLADP